MNNSEGKEEKKKCVEIVKKLGRVNLFMMRFEKKMSRKEWHSCLNC